MKTIVILALNVHFLASAVFASKPTVCFEPCPVCHGRKSVSLTPPNCGQFDGEIGVTPGKPFKTRRFDVKYDICPLCNGTGRLERWTPTEPPEDKTGLTPCLDCLGTGVASCGKCKKTGFVPCTKCANNKSKRAGWILSEEKTPGRTSRHKKKIVTPCNTCKGLGKVECPACEGRGGTVCKKCSGEGYVQKKEHK